MLDVMMPVKDGLATLRELRHPATADLPVIMLTAKAQDADAAGGPGGGCRRVRDQTVRPARARAADRALHGLSRPGVTRAVACPVRPPYRPCRERVKPPSTPSPRPERGVGHSSPTALLALGALGVVYGDIGTSPLYAMRESFESTGHVLRSSPSNVLGVLSLIIWSLIIVISIKYLVFVMKADNDGEGGILVLTSCCPGATRAADPAASSSCSGCSARPCSTATA